MIKQRHLTPQTNYFVSAGQDFEGVHQDSLAAYYQPLLGAEALGLFLALAGRVQANPRPEQHQTIGELLTQVDYGLPHFTAALDRLEGLRLVRTFVNQTSLGPLYLFEVQRPLSPVEVIQDDLLSLRLLQQVGADRFLQLSRQATKYSYDTSQFTQVTRSFFDVFRPDQASQASDEQTIQAGRQQLTRTPQSPVTVPEDGFDFAFFLSQAASLGVPTDQLQARRSLILAAHRLNNLDELQLAQLAGRATDVAANRFDPNRFEVLVDQATRSTSASPAANPQPSQPKLDLTGMTAEMQQLIKLAEELAPKDFVVQLKNQIGGYATPAEIHTLTTIATRSQLTNGAINVLAWYLLVDQGMDNISANLANSIASSWQRAGATTSVQALRQAQKFQSQQGQSGSTTNRRRPAKRGRIKEELPDWAKNKSTERKGGKVSAADAQKAAARLARLRQKNPAK